MGRQSSASQRVSDVDPPEGEGSPWSQRGSTNPAYMLTLLFFLNSLLIMDKHILKVLVEPIKAEFALSDAQIGLLTGSAYALSFGLASIPMGILVDRWSSRGMAAVSLTAWSVMTALCGFAGNYVALLLARLGVGAGEAGGGPAALSMISRQYPHDRRATAMGIYTLGTELGSLTSMVVMTQVAAAWGWRAALQVAAVPGLILAALIWLTVWEKPSVGVRKSSTADALEGGEPAENRSPRFAETFLFLFRQPSLLFLLGGTTFAFIVIAGYSSWIFSFLIREHGVNLRELGWKLGLAMAIPAAISIYGGARLADWLAAGDERWRCWIMAAGSVLSIPCGLVSLMTPNLAIAVVSIGLFQACCVVWLAPAYALSQSLVREKMRGTIAAIVFFLSNFIGYGIGPVVVGAASDAAGNSGWQSPLGVGIVVALSLNLVSAVLFAAAGSRLSRDLEKIGVAA